MEIIPVIILHGILIPNVEDRAGMGIITIHLAIGQQTPDHS